LVGWSVVTVVTVWVWVVVELFHGLVTLRVWWEWLAVYVLVFVLVDVEFVVGGTECVLEDEEWEAECECEAECEEVEVAVEVAVTVEVAV
jgi:fatty acid desaturase